MADKVVQQPVEAFAMMAGNAAPDVFYMDVRFSREFSDQVGLNLFRF